MNRTKFKMVVKQNTEVDIKRNNYSVIDNFERNFNYLSDLYNIKPTQELYNECFEYLMENLGKPKYLLRHNCIYWQNEDKCILNDNNQNCNKCKNFEQATCMICGEETMISIEDDGYIEAFCPNCGYIWGGYGKIISVENDKNNYIEHLFIGFGRKRKNQNSYMLSKINIIDMIKQTQNGPFKYNDEIIKILKNLQKKIEEYNAEALIYTL